MTRKNGLRVLVLAGLVAVVVAAFVIARTSGPDPVTTTGTHYAVTVTAERDAIDVELGRGEPDTVTVAAVMPTMGHAMPEVAARKTAPGHFVAEGDLFTMTGVWELSIRLAGPSGEETLTVNTLIGG
ncbi:hypothetical protein FH608_030560 [Nonomuraea phyllanthi]|uniref:YtkA-like domain-containing protein n=1 Tax=Nonomuraea phyllanthi TaxID=2219224 RepID=A0A5C4W3S0_9ACTN|nr:hypothetical protein [Nonomuraea phyllanthi]KAB8191594.1 hypothetical protein FH608_030560 [Nonomuraea phyllanthi]